MRSDAIKHSGYGITQGRLYESNFIGLRSQRGTDEEEDPLGVKRFHFFRERVRGASPYVHPLSGRKAKCGTVCREHDEPPLL